MAARIPVARIALSTDFGLADIYVGVMKGVIAGICPSVPVLDLCHGLPRQDVCGAALNLRAAVPYFPADTLHLVVVDPGVGTERRVLVAESRWGILVGPDNGVLAPLLGEGDAVYALDLARASAWLLPRRSQTFHGRDVFSPLAAQLAAGLTPSEVGPRVTDWQRLELPGYELREDRIDGVVALIDVFGNVSTSIPGALAGDVRCLELPDGLRIEGPPAPSYSAHPPGEALLIVNSFEALELAVNQGDAARRYGLRVGDAVTAWRIRPPGDGLRAAR